VIFGKISTGAANDLTKATDIARRMITDYGMSPRFRNVALTQRGASMLGLQPGTGHAPGVFRSTQQYIDEEIARIVNERYNKVKGLLSEKKPLLESIARHLLEKETLEEQEFKNLLSAS